MKMKRDPMEMALSTDVVMDLVLSHLQVGDLLRCRLASKFWNKAAASVLRRRSTMIKDISKEENLMEFEECMEQSSDFPFTGISFDWPWTLNSDRAMEFFHKYGSRFTRLCLDVGWDYRLHDMVPFIHHLTRLSTLEILPDEIIPRHGQSFNFDNGQGDTRILKLPSVRVIRMSPYDDFDEDVLREVLAAASPSLRIECVYATPKILQVLENAGKLRAVSSLEFDIDLCGDDYENYFDKKMDHLSSISQLPTLAKLHFSFGGWRSLDGLVEVLISSRNTLKELRLHEIRLSEHSWEKYPVLAKLTTLGLYVKIDHHDQYLFQGENGPKFPVLKELNLEISYKETYRILGANLSDGLFIVPNVTRIDFEGYVSDYGIKQLAQSFPNVVEMGLHYTYYSGDTESWYENSGSNPFEIWSVREFNCLEKLRIWKFMVKRPSRDFINMDSFLTGIPAGICGNLSRKKELVLNLKEMPFSEELSEALRDNTSIFQLRNLKELILCVKVKRGLEELPQDPPFMSMVSVWYALQMMPNLGMKFVYQYHSPPSPEEERDKAVVEGAFQQVQDYVKLEPFFY